MIDAKLDQLAGAVCVNFRYVDGGILILELQATEQASAAGCRLLVEGAWRLRVENQILVGSMNEPQVLLEHLKKLQGLRIACITCNDCTGDLGILFESGFLIESFSNSTQDEMWELRCGDGRRLGIGPNLTPYEKCVPPNPDDHKPNRKEKTAT